MKFVDLKSDRSLIKANFEGYKLSLDNIPVVKVGLEPEQQPCIRKANSDQYSFFETELFSMHNHLVQDPWNREFSYFVGNSNRIFCSQYKESAGRPEPLKTVFKFKEIPKVAKDSGCYNFSFKFVSEKFCVFCDGERNVILFDTGDRYKNSCWNIISSNQIFDGIELGYILTDARLDISNEKKIINCIFHHVRCGDSQHSNQFFWGVFFEDNENGSKKWKWEFKDVLFGKGFIYYCAFEPKSASLIVSSNKKFTFKSSDDEDDVVPEKKMKDNKTRKLGKECVKKTTDEKYTWAQTEDDVVLTFPSVNYDDKDDFKVICTEEIITVKCGEKILLDNIKMFEKVDSELTTWNLNNNSLQITLIKKNNCHWEFFSADGPAETADEREQMEMDDKPVANLETPVEECDIGLSTDEEYFIHRIHLEDKEITHQVHLGSIPPLFSTTLRPGFPPAIVTRVDVDGSLWLQQYDPSKPNEWGLRHEGNLHAFGYVQASKEQKKYVNCAPDLSYAVIAEPMRHIFIYNTKYENANNLRNRNGPQVTIGKQNLITLEQTGEVVGISCADNFLVLLTEKFLIYVQVNKVND